MNNSLKKIIEEYKTNSIDGKPTGKVLSQIKEELKKRIKNVFKEEKQIFATFGGKKKYTFDLEMNSRDIKKNDPPDTVSYNSTSKNFSMAIEVLLTYYYKKIEALDIQTILTFTNGDTLKQKNYIKKGMGFQLINKDCLFRKEIENIRAIPDECFNQYGESFSLSDQQTGKNYNVNANTDYGIEDWLDFKDTIDAQCKAFFWTPGKTNITFKSGKEPDNAVYIAYFYFFLRKNSDALNKDMANELGITDQSTRWVPRSPELAEPFSVDLKNFMQPVFFSKRSRRACGLFDQCIRCYNGSYDNDSKYQKEVKPKKEILWKIYQMLCNPDYIHENITLQSGNFTYNLPCCEKIQVEMKLIINKEILLHPKKFYILLYINSITEERSSV